MEKVSLAPLIKSPRLELRKHQMDLAKTMFEYVNADRERLGQFLPWVAHTQSVEDEESYITMTHQLWESAQMFDYGLFRREDHCYLGNIGVHNIQWAHARCELGYWILGRFEGQGYITESVQVLEKHLFDVGFNRIEIRCSNLNHRSGGIPERLGYPLEGVLRQQSFEMGAFRDTRIYARLRQDYIKS